MSNFHNTSQTFSQYLFWLACKLLAHEAEQRGELGIKYDWDPVKCRYIKEWLMHTNLYEYKRTPFRTHIELKRNLDTIIQNSEDWFLEYVEGIKNDLSVKMIKYYYMKSLADKNNPKIEMIKKLWSSN